MRRNKIQKVLYYTSKTFVEKIVEDLEEIEEKVAWLLANNEHLRNCDMCLVIDYWKYVDKIRENILETRYEIHKATSFESIRRSRQYIQNELNLWLPTEANIIEERGIKKEAVEKWIKKGTIYFPY